VLAGEFNLDDRGNRRIINNYFTFHGGFANYPRPSQALWIYSQMIRWGQHRLTPEGINAAASAYRPDLYRNALGQGSGPDDADIRVEGHIAGDRFMDGHVFEPSKMKEYIAGFAVRAGKRNTDAGGEI
jgi:NitT/TauT family transport system ATP-binding protein